jgi:hypothetical protein
MSQVCIEYNKRTRYFDYINDSYPQFLSYKSKNNKIMYNYRFQQGLLFNVSSGNVYCNYKRVCKLSPNYWFKSIPLWPLNDSNTTPTFDQREDQRLPIFHRMEK